LKENDNITNTLGLRAYYQDKYNTVFQDCYVAPTEFSAPVHKSRPSFPRPSLPTPSLHRPSLPAPLYLAPVRCFVTSPTHAYVKCCTCRTAYYGVVN